MVKAKTSTKQKVSPKKRLFPFKIDASKFEVHKPFEYCTNKANLFAAIEECAQAGDLEGIVEVLEIYFEAVEMAKQCGMYKSETESTSGESKSYSSGGTVKYASPGRSRTIAKKA